ncbi:putative bifunctional diguanylate cyclase/phosphodiesterase [Jannaschia seohaensis]|uniref:PAS domain S-box-containing protein/diguanylate cyclase (GGDEF) domain-containing protein n=1 Tax=Jannaschia seohaensis TaxID=475081 RepID=A0A2Y9A1J4_9RHOB|nr:EAL domain-containing protein [Jannaschia seohaensis]PWJ22032.1 PAS domain S-box-containing protein/diguanylate cyclase (GGDEF)-like protein [Jannaschia seohaensis]SSA38310.1 PAS domain S-box-containing protein/diguanylate cyclase (GGDEF) domain-containing protein [Jannaschia seohaensis]
MTPVIKDGVDLARLAEKLQLAFKASRMGVWEYDAQRKAVHWDDRMLEIYGITDGCNHRPDDFWETHIHPDDLEGTLAYAEECKRTQSDFIRDYRIIRADGAVRHIRSLARSVVEPDGGEKLIGVNIDVTEDYRRAEELCAAQQKLKHEALHDALTGLGNRRRLDEVTQAAFERLGKTDRYCVMHLDLDHFKAVNDTMGHLAGDFVLSTVSGILRDALGDLGTAFRVGGDEFAVFFEVAPPEARVATLADRLIADICQPMDYGGTPISVGVSIGFAFGVGPPDNPSDVFIDADAALYAAKRRGRSCHVVYSAGLRAAVTDISTARHDILGAIARDELICHYQAQFDARSLQIVGAEALVRWSCPDRGLLGPDKFLPQAAAAGLLHRIDRHVLTLVLEQQTRWHAEGVPYPPVAINTSAARLRDRDFVDSVLIQLEPHHDISFELLETAFLDKLEPCLAETLDRMRAAGLRVELDDFGSGHSSVAALQAVRPDRVKIDRSLVAPLRTRPEQALTLDALSRLARLEGAGVVVEGLESGMQLAAIRDIDCDALQGYILQRPLAADDFAAMLCQARRGVA